LFSKNRNTCAPLFGTPKIPVFELPPKIGPAGSAQGRCSVGIPSLPSFCSFEAEWIPYIRTLTRPAFSGSEFCSNYPPEDTEKFTGREGYI